MQQALSVRQLNLYVKSLLDGDVRLMSCNVCGEITNFKRHISSGHLYFTLSDGAASVKCVMFKGNALRNSFDLKDGLSVTCVGRVSLFEKDGAYQLYVESVMPAGLGDKLLALQMLKEKLSKEGLFDLESKRSITSMPKRIAVVTSGTGAALQDIINVIGRRYPVCEIVVCSASVQGAFAVGELINTLDKIYDNAEKFDTIIIGRGGGSSEDLSAFNDEKLARKIYDSPIPVISAVGHETDITICDLVADLRAPTPSAAAELAVPDRYELINKIAIIRKNCSNLLKQKSDVNETKLKAIMSGQLFSDPMLLIDNRAELPDRLIEKISNSLSEKFEKDTLMFKAIVDKIDALSPMKIMSRGYSFASSNGKNITKVTDVDIGDNILLTVTDGKIKCNVIDKE